MEMIAANKNTGVETYLIHGVNRQYKRAWFVVRKVDGGSKDWPRTFQSKEKAIATAERWARA